MPPLGKVITMVYDMLRLNVSLLSVPIIDCVNAKGGGLSDTLREQAFNGRPHALLYGAREKA